MKVFVTGATGVIGRRLIPILRARNHEVTAVARSPRSREQLTRQGAAPVEVDLFDPHAVAAVVAGQDAVINLATHMPRSSSRMVLPWAWRENDRLRRLASASIVSGCLATNVSRFIQESFAPVYPDRGDRWIDELTPISPVRYNRTIADAEASADSFSQGGRGGLVLRFGSFYGPDSLQTQDLIALIRKGWAPIPGPPTAYISPVSHDDAAAATAMALTLPAGIYNVVDDEPVTHQVFVESLADALGVGRPKLPAQWITPLLGSVGDMLARSVRISNRKLRASADWTPSYPSVRQGWPATVAGMGGVARSSPSMALSKSTHS